MTGKGFIKLDHSLLETAAWQSISPRAGLVLIDIWWRYNGKNNGEVVYSRRDAQRRLGCNPNTAVTVLRELQEKGFIVATQRGSFDFKSAARTRRATTWRLTMLPCGNQPPTHDYLIWQEAEA